LVGKALLQHKYSFLSVIIGYGVSIAWEFCLYVTLVFVMKRQLIKLVKFFAGGHSCLSA